MPWVSDADAQVTVRSLLRLDEIRAGRPEVLNDSDELDRRVRWVHVSDTEGVGALIEGGELVLSTAAGFRRSVPRMRRFLQDLATGGAAAAIIELVDAEGRPDTEALTVTRQAVVGLAIPVVVLRRRIKFVRVTHAAHRLLIGAQLARVERSRAVHEVFTQLNLESADEQRIVTTTAELLDRPVFLEDVARRTLLRSSPGAGAVAAGLDDPGTELDGQTALAEVVVGTAGHVWGRLVAPGLDPDDPDAVAVLERAGQALTLARMAARDQADLLQRAQAGFLQALMADDLTESEARARAVDLGLRAAAVHVPVAVHVLAAPGEDLAHVQLRERALLEEWLGAARPVVDSVVAAGLQTGTFVLLLGLHAQADLDATLTRLVDLVEARVAGARPLRRRSARPSAAGPSTAGPSRAGPSADSSSLEGEWTVGVGPPHELLTGGADGIDEAVQVARAAAATHTRDRPFYRYADLRLHGLVALLGNDARVRTFAEAELGPLLADRSAGSLELLELYLRHGGNKSEVARAGHLSRQGLYARLRRLEKVVGVSLDDPESRAALYVALLWWRTQTR